MHKINILAIWFQPEIGLHGYYGAILSDGTPIAMCSHESWSFKKKDSLDTGWIGNTRTWPNGKTISSKYDTKTLIEDGLLKGSPLELTVPDSLTHLITQR